MKYLFLLVLFLAACGTSPSSDGGFTDVDVDGGEGGTSGGQGGLGSRDGGATGLSSDAAVPHDCSPSSLDPQGCTCAPGTAPRACFTGDPAARGVGSCKDGTQTCQGQGEFPTWGPCTGDVTPVTESCTGTTDANCNGKTGCADPTCASDPACNTSCTDGQTRACYDGPTGTENVGICKDGTQTCVGGHWPKTCAGEVTPAPAESCCDALDHNCNHLPGCLDILQCLLASCCQSTCTQDNVTAGCVCPQGTGDTATCPDGDHGVHQGGFPGVDECCPCTASDCGDPGCCAESVCQGNSACSGLTCKPLAPSCNGQVNSDCDDFPEDCDEPCCKCTKCP